MFDSIVSRFGSDFGELPPFNDLEARLLTTHAQGKPLVWSIRACLEKTEDLWNRLPGIYSAGYKLGLFLSIVAMGFRYAWQPFFLSIGSKPDAKSVFSRTATYYAMFISLVKAYARKNNIDLNFK